MSDDAPHDFTTGSLGDLFRALRRTARCSQREFAQRMGVSPSVVSRLESDSAPVPPTWRHLASAVHAAGCQLVVMAAGGSVRPDEHAHRVNRGGRHLPAHAQVEPMSPWRAMLHADFWKRDFVPAEWTFQHPKPHSRWDKRRQARAAAAATTTATPPGSPRSTRPGPPP